ncbi:MAG: FAD-dependent oxidoreductase [Oscillospiraceae bacterium]|nr:FAD-dependent oxidoreductase [Oscillospiraceae bacterium]
MVYDLAIVGGGAAGCKAAEAAASAGMSTILLEKAQLGGNTFRAGSVPMGALLRDLTLFQARTLDRAQQYDLAGAMNRVRQNIDLMRDQQQKTLERLGVELRGMSAGFDTPTQESFVLRGEGDVVRAKRILLSTGSLPAIAHLPSAMNAIEYGTLLTSGQPLLQGALPSSILIVGTNIPSLQWAALLSAGGCKVTMLDSRITCADVLDQTTTENLMRHLQAMGVTIITQAKLTDVGFGFALFDTPDGAVRYECERVLFCRYRLPVTRGIGLSSIGLHRSEGAIVTDARARTSVPAVYAAGDCNGKTYTAQTAYREAEVAVANMCGTPAQVRYHAIPTFMEALGEMASVGYTMETAVKKDIEPRLATLPLSYADSQRFAGNGHVTIIKDSNTNRLIGAHLMGDGACHAVRLLTTAVEAGMDAQTARRYITPDNLATETVRSVLLQLS